MLPKNKYSCGICESQFSDNCYEPCLDLPKSNFTALLACIFPSFDKNVTEFPFLGIVDLKVTPFKYVTVGFLLTIISIFGLMGNVVAIIVLSKPAMKGSFSSLLIGKYKILVISISRNGLLK